MRVLHVMAGAKEGGAENIMMESVLALAHAGVPQAVVTRGENRYRLNRIRDAGVETATASFTRWWRAPTMAVIQGMIRKFKPDVIQYWMGRAGEFSLPAWKARSIGWYGGYYKLQRFGNCLWHVGLTSDIAQHILQQGAPAERIAVIHTYADFNGSREPVDRASLQTPADAPVALALSRLHEKKGLDTLLDATSLVPNLYVWIAGEGPLETELKAKAASLGLTDRVRFLGWRNDRAALLAAANLVAFPSRYEPFGTVMVDAWAASRPLVASDAAGPAAYVIDGVNGLLAPRDDAPALAAAMRRVIEDAALAAKLIAGGRASYEKGFTREIFVRDCLAFYEKVKAEPL